MFKQKKATVNVNNDNIINLDENTDYRNVSPLDYSVYDGSIVSREADREFVKKANPDDRTYDYRDPLIDADIERFKRVLDIDAIRVKEQRIKIKNGAEIQMLKAERELDSLNSLITIIKDM